MDWLLGGLPKELGSRLHMFEGKLGDELPFEQLYREIYFEYERATKSDAEPDKGIGFFGKRTPNKRKVRTFCKKAGHTYEN